MANSINEVSVIGYTSRRDLFCEEFGCVTVSHERVGTFENFMLHKWCYD